MCWQRPSAYSAYNYFVSYGLERLSFEEALKREEYVLKRGTFQERSDFTYVSHGFYYMQLLNFLEYFNRKQLLILLFDDLKANLESGMVGVGTTFAPAYYSNFSVTHIENPIRTRV